MRAGESLGSGGIFLSRKYIVFIRSSQIASVPGLVGGMATFRYVLTSFCLCCTFPQDVSFLESLVF